LSADDSLRDLPGADLVLRGLEDCSGAPDTPEAALVEIARTRLERLGMRVCASGVRDASAEIRLYERLGARHPERDPYPIYCAWLDQLDSFVWALTRRRERER
jgi:hypothetical protein